LVSGLRRSRCLAGDRTRRGSRGGGGGGGGSGAKLSRDALQRGEQLCRVATSLGLKKISVEQ
jgi:hypothetical protein